jgi:hypothetical protein
MTMLERARIAGFNLADGGTFATPVPGQWSKPLTNLTDAAIISKPARCTNPANLAASQFTLDTGRRSPISFVALLAHTLQATALYRLTYASDAAFTVGAETTGWLPVVPRIFDTALLDWEDPNYWSGRPTERELAAYGRNIIVSIEPAWSGRYLKVEIDDTGNPAGYFDLGYLFVANAFTPPFNFSRGAVQGLEFRTLADEAPSGHMVFEWRKSRRNHSIPFDTMTKEGWAQLYDLSVLNGPVSPVLFVPTLNDPKNMFREVFLGRLTAPAEGEIVGAAGRRRTRLAVSEIIA